MGCEGSYRTILVIFNVLFWISGAALITIGAIAKYDSNFVSNWESLGANSLVDAREIGGICWVLIFVGIVTFVLGGIGCLGAFNRNRCLLTLYITMIIILISVKGVAIYMLISYKNTFTDGFRKIFSDAFTKAKNGDTIALNEIGSVQTLFKCCGIDSPIDYSNNIPLSCYPSFNSSNQIYDIGCTTKLNNYINNSLPIIIVVLFVAIFIEVIAVLFSITTCAAYKDPNNNKYNNF